MSPRRSVSYLRAPMRLPTDLWTLVREEFLPAFEPGRFRITHTGSRWEQEQYVDFEEGDLIARIQRERGWYGVRFASLVSAVHWYGLNEVWEYLGLPQRPLKSPADPSELLAELRCLIEQHGESLRRAFDRSAYRETRESLLHIRDAQWESLTGQRR